ncbi:hypothetical protein BH09SUM1_BH09SUM1_02580 [soil metagenome]
MKSGTLLPGALLLVALGLLANAAVALSDRGENPRRASQFVTTGTAQPGSGQDQGGIYYLGRDTYFLTHSQDGRQVYLWYYNYNPVRGENTLEYVVGSAAK